MVDPLLAKDIIAFYFSYVIVGILSICLNATVVATIVTLKNLKQQRWLVLSAALIVADSMLSLGYAIPSIVGLDRYLNQHVVKNVSVSVATYTSVECMGINIIQISFTLFDHLVVLSIAIERVFALTKPMWYYNNSDRLVKLLLTISVCAAIIIAGCSFIDVNFNVISCGINEGFVAIFKRFYYVLIASLSGLVLIFYSIILVITAKQMRKYKKESSQNHLKDDKKVKQMLKQWKITNVIASILLIYFLTTVPAYIFTLWLIFVPTIITDSNTKVRAMLSCQLLIILNTFLNSFLYTWRNEEIRDGLKLMLKKIFNVKSREPLTTQVVPISTQLTQK